MTPVSTTWIDAVVLWDWIVCLPREYRFIWKSNWTAAKYAYLFCRYWVIVVIPFILYCYIQDHSQERCLQLFRAPVALAMWNQAGAEVVLLLRTYAFFNRDRFLFAGLLAMLCGVFAYQLYVILHEMLLLPFVPPATTGPCLPMSKPHSAHILGFFLASLAFDASVTTMTLVRAIMYRRGKLGGSGDRLVVTFLREGVFYFILISIANLINGVFYLQPKSDMSALNIPLTIMFSDVLACRMILDLRSRGYELAQPTTQHHGPTLPLSGAELPPSAFGLGGAGRAGETSEETGTTFEGEDVKHAYGQEQLPYNLPYAGNESGSGLDLKAPVGLRDLLEAGRGRGSSMLTTTIDSAAFTTSISTSSAQTRSADASVSANSMELRSFSQAGHLGDDEKSIGAP
ncbi:hypothetical protein SCHPADRAFT_665082 [Schizopora paradoxa]|uniref:DUF6533 domain-containing protein n=1 Tax=Schizopora paradoxa TaxID=27342 RepID=A0A0H2RCA2_9AGAM|nr:hypothetical protein SCHPADRAFT_665082 [Schizopora paradoxa]